MHYLSSQVVCFAVGSFLFGCTVSYSAAQENQTEQSQVFSGPQVGEPLPDFEMKIAFGANAGKELDLVAEAAEKPIVMIFVHQRSRPAFGLANAVMRYCDQQGGDKLVRGICFLTADPTDTQNWLEKIQKYFPAGTPVGYSLEGVEGPGAYGLNRNVQLTVLVGKSKQVTGNFALVQPGAHADGPQILESIADAIGSTDKPDINKYLNRNQAVQDAPIAIDPGLMKVIRQLGSKDASPDSVSESIAEIQEMIRDNQPLQQQLGIVMRRWQQQNRIQSIENQELRDQLQAWATRFAPPMQRRMDRRPSGNGKSDRPTENQNDPKLTSMLRSLIQKTNSDEQVKQVAAEIENYIESNPVARKQLVRVTNTVVNSGKLSNYGTESCQQILKEWTEKFQKQQD